MDASINGPVLAAAAAITVAVIAGSFSFLNLITSKEQKVSEFRQQWIDTLRSSLAEYLSALAYLSTFYKHFTGQRGEHNNRFETDKELQDTYARVDRSYNDIIFRINPAEDNVTGKKLNDNFLVALKKTREHYSQGQYEEAHSTCDAVREAGKPLLKHEWTRVKRGEPSYIKAKMAALAVLGSGLIAAVGLTVLVVAGFRVMSSEVATPQQAAQSSIVSTAAKPESAERAIALQGLVGIAKKFVWGMNLLGLLVIVSTRLWWHTKFGWAACGILLLVIAIGNALLLTSAGLTSSQEAGSIFGLVVHGSLGSRFVGNWLTDGAT
ncbi:hypothetical protein [Stutzerimonas chloritidismutans]|uniref:hypothetical protein n=1 Tax=Stutzerimonas chloritidismutans TaxID=203192 RepID=UPI001D185E7C|nr:hypothetical protein [Stutzerimonas chloritidismutans]UEG63237.1 hypothetical protein LLJ08_08925 [Stutzerimonas chloritidismutans]